MCEFEQYLCPNYDGDWVSLSQDQAGTLTHNLDGITIDGTTQSDFIGSDTNPFGPEIEIDGTNAGDAIGFFVIGADNVINGLVINRFGGDSWGSGRGICISGNEATGNVIIGCYIGTNRTGTAAGNSIGTDADGMTDLGNGSSGIYIDWGAQDNTIGPGNIIAFNNVDGLRIEHDTTTGNTITQNPITNNLGLGINNVAGGNTKLAPPIITHVTASTVSGSACPGCTVEVFSDSEDEGKIYEGTAAADGSGNFTISIRITEPWRLA